MQTGHHTGSRGQATDTVARALEVQRRLDLAGATPGDINRDRAEQFHLLGGGVAVPALQQLTDSVTAREGQPDPRGAIADARRIAVVGAAWQILASHRIACTARTLTRSGKGQRAGNVLGRMRDAAVVLDPRILMATAVAAGLLLIVILGGVAGQIGKSVALGEELPSDFLGDSGSVNPGSTYRDLIDARSEIEDYERPDVGEDGGIAGGLTELFFGGAMDAAYAQEIAGVLASVDEAEEHVNSVRTTWRIGGGVFGLLVSGGVGVGLLVWLRRRPHGGGRGLSAPVDDAQVDALSRELGVDLTSPGVLTDWGASDYLAAAQRSLDSSVDSGGASGGDWGRHITDLVLSPGLLKSSFAPEARELQAFIADLPTTR